jgi:two-component system, cell cycle response regulator DivK
VEALESGDEPMVAKRVLVVDDDVDHRTICVMILRHHRYEILEAEDGEEALRIVGEQHPDLVLMDARLPRMDGWQATERLKGAAETVDIPVIMITAHALKPDRERSFAAGADSFLAKPCEPIRVVEEVQRFIGVAIPS